MSNPALPTVLTVEDHPIVRADLRLLLEEAGFAVCAEARDGVEAVELASSHEPDVILLDLALPLLDGIEATRRILENRDVPIVALTGYRTEGLVERAVEAGASSYVLKPYGQAELVTAVRDAIDRHSERELQTAREASRRTLADMLTLLGYPEQWADALEADSYRRGKLWRSA